MPANEKDATTYDVAPTHVENADAMELEGDGGQEIDLADDADSEDSLTFSNGVIEKIVAIAMRDVPGVVGMKGSWFNRVQDAFGASDSTKGVTVEVTPDSAVKVNVSVLIEYGAYAPQVFEDVKRAIVKHVTGMTGLEIAGVNLRIEDVLTPEEYSRQSTAANNTAAAPAEGEAASTATPTASADSDAADEPAPAAAPSSQKGEPSKPDTDSAAASKKSAVAKEG